jgi:hypothetical protein
LFRSEKCLSSHGPFLKRPSLPRPTLLSRVACKPVYYTICYTVPASKSLHIYISIQLFLVRISRATAFESQNAALLLGQLLNLTRQIRDFESVSFHHQKSNKKEMHALTSALVALCLPRCALHHQPTSQILFYFVPPINRYYMPFFLCSLILSVMFTSSAHHAYSHRTSFIVHVQCMPLTTNNRL